MRTGGCMCGSVRYELTGEPGEMYYCHCPDCRRANGSSFAANLTIAASGFRLVSGTLETFESSAAKLRRFCGACGSPIYNGSVGSDVLTVRAGTLDGDPEVRPSMHVFTERKAPWLDITDSLPQPKLGADLAPMLVVRRTREEDLDFVLRLERDPDNTRFIGSWSREEHAAAITDPVREHWILEREGQPPAGYLIAFDLRASGRGYYVKRVVAAEKGTGLGREAVARVAAHAFGVLGAPYAWLSAYRANERAIRAYTAAGFERWDLGPEDEAAQRAVVGNRSSAERMLMIRRGPAERV